MLNLNHKNLKVWKMSLDFVRSIYELTGNFPKNEMFGITNQLRRASVSVISNIAEGASRKSPVERKRFFEISRSSLVEIDTQLEIAMTLRLAPFDKIKELDRSMNEIFAMTTSLINH